MTKRVWSNVAPAKARNGLSSESDVLGDEIGDPIAGQWCSVGVAEYLRNRGSAERVALDQDAECLSRLRPQRAEPFLSSLSMQSNLSRTPQGQVLTPEGQDLTDSGTRVVEKEALPASVWVNSLPEGSCRIC